MRITAGKVVSGHIDFEGELPDGAEVTIVAHEAGDTIEVDEETERELLLALAEAEQGEFFSAEQVLAELRELK
jgi:hypothetical protein